MGNLEQALDLGQGVYTQAEIDAIPSSLSKVASNVLMEGNLALASSAVTKSNANITYTGNGSTQSITTGISSVDFTVASNGSGYYHDRTAGDCIVKNDAGTVIESGSCVVNVSKVHIKSRSGAYNNIIHDSLRGDDNFIKTNETSSEGVATTLLTDYTSNGVTIGSSVAVNGSSSAYILHQTLYTHIKWGLTNQGKRYITAYNPVTREVMTMYQGSGIAGHQIPNPLGIKLDFAEFKSLTDGDSTNGRWWASDGDTFHYFGETGASVNDGALTLTDENIQLDGSNSRTHLNGSTYISYGFANSETKIITQYQGTGASGNFVETKDVNGVAKKPRRAVLKATSHTGDWHIFDSARANDGHFIEYNTSKTEASSTDFIDFKPNGIYHATYGSGFNTSGGQYIAIVEFDTTSSNDDTYFDLPTDDTNLTLVNGKLVFTDGRASNGGYNVSTQDFTGSIDFTGISDGIKYVGLDEVGNTVAYDDVSIGLYNKKSADDNRLVFDTDSGKWWTTTGGAIFEDDFSDGLTTGWVSLSGAILSTESEQLKVTVGSSSGYAYREVTGLTIGEEYLLEGTVSDGTTNGVVYIGETPSDASNVAGIDSTFSASFVANQTTIYVIARSASGTNGLTSFYDNFSLYKKEATLDTTLTTPISFIDDKPYQVASGTPMGRLVDYPSIPRNVMEDTYVDGDLEVSGYIKGSTINISTLPTADPFIDSELWNDSNTIKLSAGA